MEKQEVPSVLSSIASIIGSIIWPSVFLFVLLRYERPIGAFLNNIKDFSFEAFGVKTSVELKQVKDEAKEALAAAVVAHQETDSTPAKAAEGIKAASAVVDTLTSKSVRNMGRALVLWVDDIPSNNVYERQSLEALGVKFVLSTSTDDALERIKYQNFDLIISDMGRPPDTQAGYTLLDALRRSGDDTPFVIYAASRRPEHVKMSQDHGALGCTNRPDELFQYVLTALNK